MKKVILSVLTILVLGLVLFTGCYTPQAYYPIDGKVTNPQLKTTNEVYVLAQEFVIRQGETHTILYLRERDNGNRSQIEVNNNIIFNSTSRDGWWIFEFTPTETPNVYTITKMSY